MPNAQFPVKSISHFLCYKIGDTMLNQQEQDVPYRSDTARLVLADDRRLLMTEESYSPQ